MHSRAAAAARRPFVLAHPDFDIQNVLIAGDGSAQLRDLIDWDGVASVPRSAGRWRIRAG
jgi:aminoglycoside phosphotransferase (APT) family kinase protein